MYEDRKLIEGFPNLYNSSDEYFTETVASRVDDSPRVEKVLSKLDRLLDFSAIKTMSVIGCGPLPQIIKILADKGFSVTGVEPFAPFAKRAKEYVGSSAEIKIGAAEDMPMDSSSQDFIFFFSVLEHVDSVQKSLDEIYRVLAPGGAVIITTTNRYKLSLTGKNGEFNTPFYNWFPKLVKESYIFKHLHYDPKLANFTTRPAVHWFSHTDLCELGRQSGFSSFYCMLDLMRENDPELSRGFLRNLLFNKMKLLKLLQRDPWMRALALTQMGALIIMVKRPDAFG